LRGVEEGEFARRTRGQVDQRGGAEGSGEGGQLRGNRARKRGVANEKNSTGVGHCEKPDPGTNGDDQRTKQQVAEKGSGAMGKQGKPNLHWKVRVGGVNCSMCARRGGNCGDKSTGGEGDQKKHPS